MRRTVALAVVVLLLLAGPVWAYTPDRNLATFGGTLLDDLRGLLRGEGLVEGWVRIVEVGEPALWALLLVGGPIALRVLPRKTLQKYITPAPLVPAPLANPQDAAKLKAVLKGIDKHMTLLGRIKGLFMR